MRVDKLIMAGEIAPLAKIMGHPCLIFNGHQYRIYGKNSDLITGCVSKTNEVRAKGS